MVYVLGILVVTVIFGPQFWAKRVISRYNREEYFSGNGYELAEILLSRLNISHVRIEETPAGDHYDPADKVIRLNRKSCGKKSLSAVVIAAHEVGHAIQDHSNYRPLQARTRMIRTAVTVERIGAGIILAVPVFTAVTRVPAAGGLMLAGGFITLCIPILVHLVTLPTEFDASFNRALPILSTGKYIPDEDIPAARRILLACALTYVANALVSLLNIWRWIRILRR